MTKTEIPHFELGEFELRPKSVEFPAEQCVYYVRGEPKDAWARYLVRKRDGGKPTVLLSVHPDTLLQHPDKVIDLLRQDARRSIDRSVRKELEDAG